MDNFEYKELNSFAKSIIDQVVEHEEWDKKLKSCLSALRKRSLELNESSSRLQKQGCFDSVIYDLFNTEYDKLSEKLKELSTEQEQYFDSCANLREQLDILILIYTK